MLLHHVFPACWICRQRLKMILRLQFEASKLQGYDLEETRDLIRAAASVAVVKDLLDRPELQQGHIEVVEAMRPEMENTERAVRSAAGALLAQHHDSSRSSAAAVHLGATLQVYYHLGELPQAAWSAVTHALNTAQEASNAFWSATTLTELMETAQNQTRASLNTSKKPTDATLHRALKKNLRELRAEAASKWAIGVTDAANQVWNLHRVLSRKSDPVTRQVFVDVVSGAPVPESFEEFETDACDFNIFSMFWNKLCTDMGRQVEELLQYENGKLSSDVAALYPVVRAAALNMLGSLYDTMQAGSTGAWDDSATAATSVGILGGSAVLDHAFWSQPEESCESDTTFGMVSADTWTRTDAPSKSDGNKDQFSSSGTTTSLSSIFHSDEWKVLLGSGLMPLQEAFLEACSTRLCEPLQYFFPDGVTVDEDGIPMSVLPAVPSRYDMQKLDALIRSELSLADPREGGGELSMTSMIAEVVVDMVERFCNQAKGAVSDVGEKCIRPEDGTATEALVHDIKVAGVMVSFSIVRAVCARSFHSTYIHILNVLFAQSSLATSLRNAPENTFIVPYRPATNLYYEEAASACQVALLPALYEIENMVTTLILTPLCKALNRRVGAAIAKMHYGTYFGESLETMDGMGTSFVQKHLAGLYDAIAQEHLASLPTDYAAIVASTVATFSIYSFVSNVSLIRPLKETAKLHITQDLADFELALEQLVFKAGSSLSLSQVERGKPYSELRAVRQMLFWSGLDDKTAPVKSLTKALLQEPWAKDVRVSTICHFLFSFSPNLLSSPHHSKRLRPEEYVSELVRLDGSVDDGETSAWMTTMACCDSYQQRESVGVSDADGDKRMAAVVMTVGPELLRRRRQ